MEEKQYNYYAFISYSRKDEKWARWLQNRLETYRLPAAVRKEHLDIPRRIFPVFRDKTDLTSGKLESMLEQELDASKYLIVICSPSSANSDWVNKEISRFIQMGREDRIIPFIVSGTPYAEKDQLECFPSALKHDVQQELLGISVAELGRTPAFLRVVATLLSIKYDQLVMRHRKRMLRRRILIGVTVFLLMALDWYNSPHSAYYADYVYVYEIPKGIYRLSKRQRSSVAECYRIITLRGRVVRLVRVNSAGTPINPSIYFSTTDYPITDFVYNEDGQLSRTQIRDVNGQLIMQKTFSFNLDEQQIAVDYQQPNNGSQTFSATANYASSRSNADAGRSDIVRLLNTYDEDGFLTQSLYYQDNRNHPACDPNGIYGVKYERNKAGQLLCVTYLDAQGAPHNSRYGVAGESYEYDGQGHLLLNTSFNIEGDIVRSESGYAQTSMTYDGKGNLIVVQYLDENGAPCNCSDGFSKIEMNYDKQGFMTHVQFFNAKGEPAFLKESGIHDIRYEQDSQGRRVSESYYDEKGELAYCLQGFAQGMMAYDEQGRRTMIAFYDTEGNLTYGIGGFADSRIYYDANGYKETVNYLDTSGWIIDSISYQYDNNGNVLREEYCDGGGSLFLEGVAIVEFTYDSAGNQTSVSFKDRNDEPCTNEDGYGSVKWEYENGNKVSERYYSPQGTPINVYGYHECQTSYDERGNPIQYTYYDEEGELVQNGIAICEMKTDQYGNLLTTSYYDASGEPVQFNDGDNSFYKSEYAYDQRGNQVRETIYSLTGIYDHNYATILREYDAYHNITKESYLDAQGLPCEDENGVGIYLYSYDEKSQMLLEEYQSIYGEQCAKDGYVAIEYQYDVKGRISCSKYFTSADNDAGREIDNQIIYTYNNDNSVISRNHFDKRGNLIVEDSDAQIIYLSHVSDSFQEKGILPGDIVLKWNDWMFFAKNGELGNVSGFREEIRKDSPSIHLVVARETAEDQFEFFEINSDDSHSYYRMELTDLTTIKRMREQYEAWQGELSQ